MADGPDPILELIAAYEALAAELEAYQMRVHHAQGTEEISHLKSVVCRLENIAGIEWMDGKPRWKHQSCSHNGGGQCRLNERDHYHLARPGRPDEVVYYGSAADRKRGLG
jgi:hypothetical protein